MYNMPKVCWLNQAEISIWQKFTISYPEQLAQLFDFTDGLCERHQIHNKASKGTGFEFGFFFQLFIIRIE